MLVACARRAVATATTHFRNQPSWRPPTSSASPRSITTAPPPCCGTARSSRPPRRSASPAMKGDAAFPGLAVEYCLSEAGIAVGGSHLRRLLRQAAAQVRAHPRDVPRHRPARASGPSCMAGPLWIKEKLFTDRQLRDELGYEGEILYCRAPRVARGQRVLPVAIRGGGYPDDRRRRRVGDRIVRRRPRQRHRDPQGAPLARLARPPVLRLHLLHRLQGELRRVQGDGARAVRRAEVRAT